MKRKMGDDANISERTITIVLTATAAAFVVMFGLLVLDGFIFSNMWRWWVTYTFGVRQITVVEAIGLSLVIQYFRYPLQLKKDKILNFFVENVQKDLLTFLLAYLLFIFFR